MRKTNKIHSQHRENKTSKIRTVHNCEKIHILSVKSSEPKYKNTDLLSREVCGCEKILTLNMKSSALKMKSST